jgi:hypothetical protein
MSNDNSHVVSGHNSIGGIVILLVHVHPSHFGHDQVTQTPARLLVHLHGGQFRVHQSQILVDGVVYPGIVHVPVKFIVLYLNTVLHICG